MSFDEDASNVAREDRIERVLRLLVESDCALPPAAIFRNAKLRGADFERRSIDNFLEVLHSRGLVIKVAVDSLDEGAIEEVGLSEHGYYMATDAGRESLDE